MEEPTFIRKLSIFDKETERRIAKHDITISREELRKIIKPRPNDPYIITPYDIDEEAAELIQPYTDIVFDFEKYLYEVGTYKPLVDGKYIP